MTTIYLDHAATTPVHPEVTASYIKLLGNRISEILPVSIVMEEKRGNGWILRVKHWRSPSMLNRRKSFSRQAARKRII